MATTDLGEITSTAEDYLKLIWSATEWGDPPITTKGLADRLGTTSATVSDTVRRLTTQGLLDHQPYKPISLTPLGEQHALQMVRRHRLIEMFLVTTLGYTATEVHDEAEALEHAVSELMIERIDALLGHPSSDPHGDPIPGADGRIRRPEHIVRLSAAEPGAYDVYRISDVDPDRLAYLLEQGLAPGLRVAVGGRDDRAHTTRLTLGDRPAVILAVEVADAVMLTPAP